jgi:hypothetical protein
VSILKSTNLIKFCVLTHCVQCLNVAVVAYLTMLLKLDNVDNDLIERAAGLVSARITTNVLFYLALDAWNAIIYLLTTLAIGSYLEASG